MTLLKALFILCLFPPFANLSIAGDLPVADTEMHSPSRIVSTQTQKGRVSWSVELAADDAARATGLMHRQEMPFGHGMLFRFDVVGPVAMWMKNTFIPLDMIFLDEQGTVTHIHRGAVPQDLSVINSNGPVRYVLEVNAKEVDLSGLVVGDRLQHPWFAAGN